MATLVLSAAGAAFGGGLGGSLLGVTTMALGKAAGAALGSMVDQRILGAGSAPVETGRVDRFRVMGSAEGTPLPRCFGRVRLPGQLIWSSRFCERVARQDRGGKGSRGQTIKQYSYSISLALALCEGEIYRIGRIWADGQPVDQSTLTWRLHKGTESQEPDPVISAIEGAAYAPAYRGIAYILIEDLDLTPYGNRIPQFNFEVFRRPQVESGGSFRPPALEVRAVALVPGTGEYALATQPVVVERGRGDSVIVNVNNDRGIPDLVASLDQMDEELPRCEAVSLVVSWFGDDLRINRCSLYPAVEQKEVDGREIAWRVAGVDREGARAVKRVDDRPLFGGTPADHTVVQAIRQLAASGKAVMFYPFILMDVIRGSGLEDPWNLGSEQPAVPWRGRMTLSRAPGTPDSPDRTAAAAAEVDAFFGTAEPDHFTVSGGWFTYSGPSEWSYRRFILHYAALCAAAGGVDAFCIGTEMRGLTQIRDGVDSYPAVRALRRLASDVRVLLGPKTKIGYAADWSEYFGHQPNDGSGDVLFHLDDLWADPSIDFVGIDNYMPLSDWRDGSEHLDAPHGSLYNLEYMKANVAGGEGFDWYYPNAEARVQQLRHPIEDGAYGEDWIYRYKDLRSWWSNKHFNRSGGVRAQQPTAWQPRSKPFWFTELGCPAVDKGSNQPNVFFDPKSSESLLPYFSDGSRDDQVQQSYLAATNAFWSDPDANPASPFYDGRMVDLSRCFVWAWDARPWPDFPLRKETWVDGPNFQRGHWLNGRIGRPRVCDVVSELCAHADFQEIEAAEAYGLLTGYAISDIQSTRQIIQPLLLAHALDVHTAGSRMIVRGRGAGPIVELDLGRVACDAQKPRLDHVRSATAELPTRLSLGFIRADLDYQSGAVEAALPDASEPGTSKTELPLVLSDSEALGVVERWLHESHMARDTLSWLAAPSSLPVGIGDAVSIKGARPETYRIDRVVERGVREITAVRMAHTLYRTAPSDEPAVAHRVVIAPSPVYVEVLDLPLLKGDEKAHAPHVAVLKRPWAGPVAVYAAHNGSEYQLASIVDGPTSMGSLLDSLPSGDPGLWMRHSVRVRMEWGVLSSRSELDVFSGYNAAALKTSGTNELELIQFLDARLVAPSIYELSNFLRGQAGTDFCIPPEWPAGTDFILLDGNVRQIEVPEWSRGLDLHIKAGLSTKFLGDGSFAEVLANPRGAGLRPYRPVHLKAKKEPDGSLDISWIRRTRIDGDSWQGGEVAVGEESILFNIRLFSGERLLRAGSVPEPKFLYRTLDQVADGMSLPLTVEVAQVSAHYGEGPINRIIIND